LAGHLAQRYRASTYLSYEPGKSGNFLEIRRIEAASTDK